MVARYLSTVGLSHAGLRASLTSRSGTMRRASDRTCDDAHERTEGQAWTDSLRDPGRGAAAIEMTSLAGNALYVGAVLLEILPYLSAWSESPAARIHVTLHASALYCVALNSVRAWQEKSNGSEEYN